MQVQELSTVRLTQVVALVATWANHSKVSLDQT
jgi:hypothetical protein